jgi:quercetin dioxygenase-like cupin family protein
MKISGVPFTLTNWRTIPGLKVPGDSGTSTWRTVEAGGIRIRLVEYSPGFRSDHWCARGHVLKVLEGEVTVRLKDGREFALGPGAGFVVGDDEANPHMAFTEQGARVFIVD